MPYRLLADLVLVLHLCFVGFVVAGGLAVLRWPRLAWLHLPALALGAWVVLAGEVCPMTPLENSLRQAAGGGVYRDSFIEHYLIAVIYPPAVQRPTGRSVQVGLGVALVAFNAVVYVVARRRWRRAVHPHEQGVDASVRGQ